MLLHYFTVLALAMTGDFCYLGIFFLATIKYSTQKSKIISLVENLIFIPEHYACAHWSLCKGDSLRNFSGEALVNHSDLPYNAFWGVITYVFFSLKKVEKCSQFLNLKVALPQLIYCL